MMFIPTRHNLSTALIVILIASQLIFSFSFLLVPKKAEAFWGFGDLNIKIGDIVASIKQVVEGILIKVATQYANKYLTKFVQKLQDKYRIKDFLFYDQYLSDHYLTNFINTKIKDPNLRGVADLMNRITLTGQTGGYTGTDPRKALIPQLRIALAKAYTDQGGIPPSNIYAPRPGTLDIAYFQRAQAYFANPPSYTESNLRGQYGAFQAAATSASQLEIMLGQGLKAGRIIGGTCTPPKSYGPNSIIEGSGYFNDDGEYMQDALPGTELPPEQLPPDPGTGFIPSLLQKFGLLSVAHAATFPDPVSCAKSGGKWNESALDYARSFITNPTGFVQSHMEQALGAIFKNNYDATNIWAQIGSFLGGFIFDKLNLNDSSGTFNEAGTANGYDPGKGTTVIHTIDIDGDGIPDGEDTSVPPDGVADLCYHGDNFDANGRSKTPIDCKGSKTLTPQEIKDSPFLSAVCKSTDDAIEELQSWLKYQTDHQGEEKSSSVVKFGPFYVPGAVTAAVNFKDEANAQLWGEHGSQALAKVDSLIQVLKDKTAQGWNFDQVPNSNIVIIHRYSVYLDLINKSLYGDADVDLQKGWGTGEGGFYKLYKRTENIIKYITEFKAKIKKCDDPDTSATATIVDPGVGIPEGNVDEGVPPPADAATKHGNHTAEVTAAKAQLTAQGMTWNKDPAIQPTEVFECNRFAIVKLAAQLIGAGAGLLSKPGGTNCQGYSVDIIAFPDGYIYDVLDGNAPDGAGPAWSPSGCGSDGICPDRYRAPI